MNQLLPCSPVWLLITDVSSTSLSGTTLAPPNSQRGWNLPKHQARSPKPTAMLRWLRLLPAQAATALGHF